MYTQYLARHCPSSRDCEALLPQIRDNRAEAYHFAKNCSILSDDCTQAIHTSKFRRGLGVCLTPLSISDRRIQCRTLLKASWLSVCSLPSRLASRRPKMTTLWSSRSQKSQFRPANTAASTNPNPRNMTLGQAVRPVSVPPQRPLSEGVA